MQIISKEFFSRFWKTFKKSLTAFINDNAIKLSASLSYYTVFSLPPLIIILITVVGSIFGREAIQGEIYGQIRGFVGGSAAAEIQSTIKNIHLSGDTYLATIIGIVTLLIGATGAFGEIQDSINYIWGIKAKPKRGIIKLLLNRLMSFSMIAVCGFLLMVSLTVNALLDIISDRLQRYFSHITVTVFFALNLFLVFAVITSLFAVVYKMLPDGKVKWRDAFFGASFTAIFFMIGKQIIGAYLGVSSLTSMYGAAGSVVLILLWVYYSSFILFFGAEFTKVYATTYGSKITPNDYAVRVEVREVEHSRKKKLSKG